MKLKESLSVIEYTSSRPSHQFNASLFDDIVSWLSICGWEIFISKFSQWKKPWKSRKCQNTTKWHVTEQIGWISFIVFWPQKSVHKSLFTAQRDVRTKLGNYQLCRLNEFEISRTFPTEIVCHWWTQNANKNCLKILSSWKLLTFHSPDKLWISLRKYVDIVELRKHWIFHRCEFIVFNDWIHSSFVTKHWGLWRCVRPLRVIVKILNVCMQFDFIPKQICLSSGVSSSDIIVVTRLNH